jgi:hypothetical protein
MIQSPDNIDRGAYLFSKYGDTITAMVNSRVEQWAQSTQFQGFRNNCRSMDQYIDCSAPSVSTFISDLTPPVIRKAYFEFSALFAKFLETDPLFSIRRQNGVTVQQEREVQAFLSDNTEKTCFREKCLPWLIDNTVRYGTFAAYTFATSEFNANSLMTIKGDDGDFGDYKQIMGQGEGAIVTTALHPLNIIIDPRSNYQVVPAYLGFIGDISVANIVRLKENPAYVQDKLAEVIELCKKGLPDEYWFAGTGIEARRDLTRGHSQIRYLWTDLPFEGNEDDSTVYCVEVIGGRVIRIEENVVDGGVIPLALGRVFPRPYSYWGNSPLTEKVQVQNMMYWLINAQIESTARAMDRIVLYNKGDIDAEALNSRHTIGGLVGVENKPDLSKLLFSPQMPASGFQQADWLVQEMRREDQDTSAMPNFNPQSEGGPTNKTLGGAQIMASIGELKIGALVNQMAIGLKDIAKHVVFLQRNLATEQMIPLSNGQTINKESLLGNLSFTCKISNVFNYIREAIDAKNRLMDIINLQATKRPEMQALRVSAFLNEFVRASVKRENIDDYVNTQLLDRLEQQAQQQAVQPPAPPQMPGMPGPGGPPAGGPPPGAPVPQQMKKPVPPPPVPPGNVPGAKNAVA